ncbi:MAG TPA: hypothetical protein VN639_15755 [Azonexus sp.]|nr:hypothetical protein [Azonexus sp.]
MAIRALIIGALALASLPFAASTAPASATSVVDLCAIGHVPAGWKRPGGYCDIAADTNQHNISAGGGGFSGSSGGGGGCAQTFTNNFGTGCLVGQVTTPNYTYDVYKFTGVSSSPTGVAYVPVRH